MCEGAFVCLCALNVCVLTGLWVPELEEELDFAGAFGVCQEGLCPQGWQAAG